MKVGIKMETRQKVDGEMELITHEARGILRKQGESRILTYLLDGIHHEMVIDESDFSVSVVRNWQEKGKLCYKRGLKHKVMYETPMGSMELRFDTKQLLMDLPREDEGPMVVEMNYEVFQFGSPIMECELRIDIFPLK